MLTHAEKIAAVAALLLFLGLVIARREWKADR